MWTPMQLGGVGKLPWTIMGSNLDTVIAIECSNSPQLTEVVNDAAYFLSKVTSNIKMEIKDVLTGAARRASRNQPLSRTASVMYSEMAPGIAWIKSNLSASKVQAARYAADVLAKNKAPRLGDLFYPDQPITTSVKAIVESKAAGILKSFEKIASGRAMIDLEGPSPDLLQSKFGWIRKIKFTRVAELPLKKSVMDIPNAGYNDESVLRTRPFGTSTDMDANSFSPAIFLNILFQDPLFPKNVTVDMIFNYISSPRVMFRKENVFFALVAMGASSSAATRVTDLMYEQGAEAAVKINATHVSLKTESLSWISRSKDSYEIATEMAEMNDMVLNQIVKEAAFGYAVMSPVPSRVLVEWTEESMAAMYEELGGRSERISDLYTSFVGSVRSGVDPFSVKSIDPYRMTSVVR
jgi:hypothetical protein